MQPCKVVLLSLVALLGAPAVRAAEETPPAAVKPLKKKKPGPKVRAPPAVPGEVKEKPKTSTAALSPLPENYAWVCISDWERSPSSKRVLLESVCDHLVVWV
jgi:hypothetical protein